MSFENQGQALNLDEAEKMECGVCWHVYDPAEGDYFGQIPAGTPFSALPEDWRCPHCDGASLKYMRLGDG